MSHFGYQPQFTGRSLWKRERQVALQRVRWDNKHVVFQRAGG